MCVSLTDRGISNHMDFFPRMNTTTKSSSILPDYVGWLNGQAGGPADFFFTTALEKAGVDAKSVAI